MGAGSADGAGGAEEAMSATAGGDSAAGANGDGNGFEDADLISIVTEAHEMVDQESAWVDLRKIAKQPQEARSGIRSAHLRLVQAGQGDRRPQGRVRSKARPDTASYHGPHQGLTADRRRRRPPPGPALSYAVAGVDIAAADAAKRDMARLLAPRDPRILNGVGPFATLIDASFPDYRHPVTRVQDRGARHQAEAGRGPRRVPVAVLRSWSTTWSTTSW